jgi:hypothetical protein
MLLSLLAGGKIQLRHQFLKPLDGNRVAIVVIALDDFLLVFGVVGHRKKKSKNEVYNHKFFSGNPKAAVNLPGVSACRVIPSTTRRRAIRRKDQYRRGA